MYVLYNTIHNIHPSIQSLPLVSSPLTWPLRSLSSMLIMRQTMARPELPRNWAHSLRHEQRSDKLGRFEKTVRCRRMPLLIFLTRSGTGKLRHIYRCVFSLSFRVCPFGGLHRIWGRTSLWNHKFGKPKPPSSSQREAQHQRTGHDPPSHSILSWGALRDSPFLFARKADRNRWSPVEII